MPEGMRLDKWLWAARFFKTRPLAQKAIAGGKVKVGGVRCKAGRTVQVGQAMEIRVGQTVYQVIVTGLSEKRGPASVARTLYEETEESVRVREAAAEARRQAARSEPKTEGRPDRYQRRLLRRFREQNR